MAVLPGGLPARTRASTADGLEQTSPSEKELMVSKSPALLESVINGAAHRST